MADNTLVELFEEFLTIYKVTNRKAIIDILQAELNTSQLKEIYNGTDGKKSSRDLAALLSNKCSHTKVARLWNKWALIGIIAIDKTSGKQKAVFNLNDYGIACAMEDEKSLKEIGEIVGTSSKAVRLFAVSLEKAGLIEYITETKVKCPKRVF
jgi:hypothetical protein